MFSRPLKANLFNQKDLDLSLYSLTAVLRPLGASGDHVAGAVMPLLANWWAVVRWFNATGNKQSQSMGC